MRIPRIYHPTPLAVGARATLTPEATQHVQHVLRLKVEDQLCLFAGDGAQSEVTIVAIGKNAVTVEATSYSAHNIESPRAIHLWQGLCRGERMDWILQKTTELGVSAITPVFTERSLGKLDPARTEKRQGHWQKVLISACEQCGRNRIPTLHAPLSLDTIPVQTGLCLVLDPLANSQSPPEPSATDTIHLFIGPEGGLSAEEISLLSKKGFAGLRMGPRILRVETAALAAVTLVQARWGDL